MSHEERVFLPTKENVKVIGRTIMLNNCRLLCASGSGVEFTYNGTKLEVTFLGDSSTYDDGTVKWRDISRVQVYVDDRVMLDTTIKKDKETYVVYGEDESAEPARHIVKILKLSEPRMSSVGLGEIKILSDEGPVPTPYKEKFVEFVGDSITCGYGVDTKDELCPFSTGTENATKAFAYLSAKELDVDYSLVSYSGHGLISGYTPDPNVPKKEELMQPYYGITAYSYNSFNNTNPKDTEWDFKRKPDVIVINLGTNDFSYVQNDASKTAEFEVCYVDFLKQVRKLNPDSHIICALGIMGDELFPAVERAAGKYENETGDTNVSTLRFTPQNPDIDGYCADYHPSERTHLKATKEMVEELKKWL